MSLIASHLMTVVLGICSLLIGAAAGIDCAAWLFLPVALLVIVNLTGTRGRHGRP